MPLPASRLPTNEVLLARDVRDRGRATALAAVESIVAFAVAGEKEKIGAMIAWTWKASADLSFSGVPEPWRSQAGSAENLQGLAEVQLYSDVGAIQLMHRIVISPTEEVIALRLSRANGNAWERTYHLRKADDAWFAVQRPSQVLQTVLVLKGEYLPALSFEREYSNIQPTSGPKPPLPLK